jgi:glycosyltransferase involved in cell wall biosynthesis
MSPLSPKPPSVTIVTVVRNHCAQIASTIESVLNQRHVHFEYVVVDGASTDGTLDQIRRYRDRIDIIISEPDRGIYDAMNKGISHASGDYLLMMNAGDSFIDPEALHRTLQWLPKGEEAVLFSQWIRDGTGPSQRRCAPDLAAGIFNHQAILYSRSIHSWHGLYLCVPGLTTADYLFFRTLLASGKVRCAVTPELLARVDISGLSSGPQTFPQKSVIDYLCGQLGRSEMVTRICAQAVKFSARRMVGRS